MNKRRVVITGIGCITPLGNSIADFWDGLIHGRSGVARTSVFDGHNFPTKIAAEVKGWNIADVVEDPDAWKYRSRHTQFAAGASKQAFQDSGLADARLDPRRFGVYLGAGEGPQDFRTFTRMMSSWLEGDRLNLTHYLKDGLESLHPMIELEQEPNMPAACVASMFNAQGPNSNCLTACAASSQALGEATELIRRGDADVMLSGGAHSMIHPFGVTGFNLLTAMSTFNENPAKASRPFDLNRDGFVLGEGASMLVVEELEHALHRGAKIYAEVLGYGSTSDAYRLTDTHPEGRGAISCLKMAFADADLAPEKIDYINAHGTSTENNDKVETLAIKSVFGEQAYRTPVSSTKSMHGHMIAAAGATEAIVCLLAIQNGVVPPTINLDTPDPNCDLDYIPHVARERKVDIALSNSFGFGGQNISLILGRYGQA
ncbi:MAG TPA: beta-ketoacyl-ACP synthase II [Pirellulales bacterium]|jgi:3-oxoacyl-[acyl-carrier-protein] synthase II|nr:beta-ketoacyl-ACP synthase II [Pirellulales bacterium]